MVARGKVSIMASRASSQRRPQRDASNGDQLLHQDISSLIHGVWLVRRSTPPVSAIVSFVTVRLGGAFTARIQDSEAG